MAAKENFVIDQGASFSRTISYRDANGAVIDLTGYTANSSMKTAYANTNTAATFTTSVNEANGQVTLTMNTSVSAALTAKRYVYDVKVTSGNTVTRIREGIVTVSPKVV